MIIYLTEQGLRVNRESQRLRFESKNGNLLQEVRLADIESIVVFGRISFTPPAIHALLKRNIDIHFLSLSGNYLGKLSPPLGKNVELRIKQFEAFKNNEYRLKLAKRFVHGKIFNQKQFLSRQKKKFNKADLDKVIGALKKLLTNLETAVSLEEIIGIEGLASKHYFTGLAIVFKHLGFSFKGRTRRPPKDPINALLSLGYMLLATRIWSFVETASLDPYLGFLHSPDYGKPSLVLDLMEEWRPVIVDALVVRVLGWGTIKRTDFTKEAFDDDEIPGTKLTRDGLKKFVAQFQQKLKEEASYEPFDKKFKYKDILKEQVYLLARVLKGEAEKYISFEMK